MKTKINALQKYLNHLCVLLAAEDKAGFVDAFVPKDLTEEDKAGFLKQLESNEGNCWTYMVAEIMSIAEGGDNVVKITGEKKGKKVVFYFEHPILPKCDREVEFIKSKDGVWTANA